MRDGRVGDRRVKMNISIDEVGVIHNCMEDIENIPLDQDHHSELIAATFKLIGVLHVLIIDDSHWDITE